MELNMVNSMMRLQRAGATEELAVCNQAMAQYGLSLTQDQMQELVERRYTALRATGRVEFGRGVLREIVLGFCSSPYVSQDNYEDTIADVQDTFYRRKEDAEAGEPLPDDDLVEALRYAFDHEVAGSTDALDGVPLATLRAYAACEQTGDYDEQTQQGYFDEEEAHDGEEKYVRDELSRVYDEEQGERPSNEYAASFYDGYSELYRVGFDSESRIEGSSLG